MAVGLTLTTSQRKVFDETLTKKKIKYNTTTGVPDITNENYFKIVDAINDAHYKAMITGADTELLRIVAERLDRLAHHFVGEEKSPNDISEDLTITNGDINLHEINKEENTDGDEDDEQIS